LHGHMKIFYQTFSEELLVNLLMTLSLCHHQITSLLTSLACSRLTIMLHCWRLGEFVKIPPIGFTILCSPPRFHRIPEFENLTALLLMQNVLLLSKHVVSDYSPLNWSLSLPFLTLFHKKKHWTSCTQCL